MLKVRKRRVYYNIYNKTTPKWWEEIDSNYRSEDTTDLQSAPFGQLRNLPIMVEVIGVEPMTFCLQGRRSSQLNYTPILEPLVRIELTTY